MAAAETINKTATTAAASFHCAKALAGNFAGGAGAALMRLAVAMGLSVVVVGFAARVAVVAAAFGFAAGGPDPLVDAAVLTCGIVPVLVAAEAALTGAALIASSSAAISSWPLW